MTCFVFVELYVLLLVFCMQWFVWFLGLVLVVGVCGFWVAFWWVCGCLAWGAAWCWYFGW